MQEFECHFSFITVVQTHGRDEEGASDNVRSFLDDDFVNVTSNHLKSIVDYDVTATKEVENGWFELELRWSSYWNIDANSQDEAKSIAEEWLDSFLTPVYQSLENLSTKIRRFHFIDFKNDEIVDIIDLAAPVK